MGWSTQVKTYGYLCFGSILPLVKFILCAFVTLSITNKKNISQKNEKKDVTVMQDLIN